MQTAHHPHYHPHHHPHNLYLHSTPIKVTFTADAYALMIHLQFNVRAKQFKCGQYQQCMLWKCFRLLTAPSDSKRKRPDSANLSIPFKTERPVRCRPPSYFRPLSILCHQLTCVTTGPPAALFNFQRNCFLSNIR